MESARIPIDITEALQEPTFDEIVEALKVWASIEVASDKLRVAIVEVMKKIVEKAPKAEFKRCFVGLETRKLLLPVTGLSGQFLGMQLEMDPQVPEGELRLEVNVP